MNSRIEKWIQQVEMSLQSDVTMQQLGEGLSGEAEEESRDQFSCGTGGPLGLEVRAEAQSIITALMAGESPVAADPPRLLSPDWSADLDIQSAASSIVDQLMNKPLDISLAVEEEQQRMTDPRVTMEMRHRKIQEKRKARERAQRMEAKEKVDRKEARRRAEHEVQRLERERRAKEKADEALVQLEMTRIRKQMQEERAKQQWYNDAAITAHCHGDMVCDKSAAPVSEVEVDRHQIQGGAERPPKKRAKRSKHTRGAAMAEDNSNHPSHPLPPPPSSKSRDKGEDGRSRHKDAHYETCDIPKPSTTSVVPSLSSTSSASSLVRMERVTAHEQRQRLKVMHKSFAHWQRLFVRLRIAGGRAAATWEWKTMLRAWREWKMAVEEKQKEKTFDVTSAVQNELRLASMAVLHHKRYQLRRCFNVWSRWCREEASRREMACKAELRKEKMSSLLQAVRRKGEKQPRPQQPAPPIPPSNTQQQPSSPDLSLITSKIVRQELEKILVDSKLKLASEAQPSVEGDGPVTSAVAGNTGRVPVANDQSNARSSTKDAVVDSRRSVVLGKASASQENTPHPPASAAVSEGRQSAVLQHSEIVKPLPKHEPHVEHQLNTEAEAVVPPNTTGKKLGSMSTAQAAMARGSSHSVVEEKLPSRKPPTKPVSLFGMERRTEEIARRKEERKRRQKQAEEEELTRKTEEEEQKAREARDAKEALLRKKREERELAKQKELDRQKQMEHTRQLNEKACSHYKSLQCKQCLSHWKQFVLMVQKMTSEADSYHQSTVCKQHFVQWLVEFEGRVEAMSMKASQFHHIHLMKRTFHGLSEHLQRVRDLKKTAIDFSKHRLVRLHLKAWLLYVTEEKLGMWERERTAKKHRNRMLITKMFRSWLLFVPLSKQEREKERRRAELRLKVASWLPDYQAT